MKKVRELVRERGSEREHDDTTARGHEQKINSFDTMKS
jgi:hypothetical protein